MWCRELLDKLKIAQPRWRWKARRGRGGVSLLTGRGPKATVVIEAVRASGRFSAAVFAQSKEGLKLLGKAEERSVNGLVGAILVLLA